MKSGIYVIEICGIYYIGSAIDFEKRFKRHIRELSSNTHHNIILQRSFNKYGITNLKTIILEQVDYTKELILEKEQYYIDLYRKDYGKRCCNLSGASFGDTKTDHPDREEIIYKTTKKLIEYYSKMSEEEKQLKYGNVGIKNGMYGKTHSEKTKQMISEKNKGRKPINSIAIKINEKMYNSFQEASTFLGVAATTIRRRCLSKSEKFKEYKIL